MRLQTNPKGFEPWTVPVFPLPNTVFFPGTTLPLHVFEPRYRAMVRDVAEEDRLIVISLKAGDDFRDLGTLGYIRDLEPLSDGGFKLQVTGLERVSLTEVPVDTPYRRARVVVRPERTGTVDASRIREARLQLLASYGMLRSMVRTDEPLILQEDLPFDVIVNVACSALPVDATLLQGLLQKDTILDRQRLAQEYFSTAIEALSWLRVMKGTTSSLMN